MKNLLPLFLWPFLANLAIGQQPKLPDSVTIGELNLLYLPEKGGKNERIFIGQPAA